MRKRKSIQKLLAMILSAMMVVGVMPVSALAQEFDGGKDLVWNEEHTQDLLSEGDLLGNPAATFVLKGLASGVLSSIGGRAMDEAMAQMFGQPPSEISQLINAFQGMAEDIKSIKAEIDNLSAKIDQANLKSDLREYAGFINEYAAAYEHLSNSLSTYGSNTKLTKPFLTQLYSGTDVNFNVDGKSLIVATLSLGNYLTKPFPGNNYNIFGAFDLQDKFRNQWEHQGYAQRQAFRDEAIYTYGLFCTMAQLACQTAIENNPGDSAEEQLERSKAELWLKQLKENAAKVYAMDQRCAVKEHPDLRIYRDIKKGKDLYVFKTQVEIGKLPWQWTSPYTPQEYLYPMARTQKFNREDFANSYNLYSQQPSVTMYQKIYDDYGSAVDLTSIFFDADKGNFTLPSNANEVTNNYFATNIYTIQSNWHPMFLVTYAHWLTNVVDNKANDEERSLIRLFINMNGDTEVLNRHGNANVFSPIYYYGAVEQGKLMLPDEEPSPEPADKISGMASYYELPYDDSVTLSVKEKEGYTPQWYVNIGDGNGYKEIAGATDSTYTLPTLIGNMDGYQYICAYVKHAGEDDLGHIADMADGDLTPPSDAVLEDSGEPKLLSSDETTDADVPAQTDTDISVESVEDPLALTEEDTTETAPPLEDQDTEVDTSVIQDADRLERIADMTNGDFTPPSDAVIEDSGEPEILPSDETIDPDVPAQTDTDLSVESVEDPPALTEKSLTEPASPLEEQEEEIDTPVIQSVDISVFSGETEEEPPVVWVDSNIYTAPVTLVLGGEGVYVPETEHEVSSVEELAAALERVSDGEWDGHILRLTADIDYPQAITLIDRSLTLELNGFTLTVAPSMSTTPNVDPMSSAPEIAAVYVGNNSTLVTQSYAGGALNISAGDGITYGVYAVSESYAEVSSVSIEGSGTAVYAENGRSVIITGDLRANGPEAVGVSCVDGGQIEIRGDVTVSGASSYGAKLGSSSGKTSYITIKGNLSVLGLNSRGGFLDSANAMLTVKGNITASNGFAGISAGKGQVSVHGDVSAQDTAISAWDEATLTVRGKVTSTGRDGTAISSAGATVDIGRSVFALGSHGTGVAATAWDIANPALAAQVTVDGILSAATPLRIEGSPVVESEHAELSTKPEYNTFTDGKNTVWVKPSSFVIPVFYALTVNANGGNGATGEGSYTKDATIHIYAGTRSGYSFSNWSASGVTLANANSATTTFTMPANAVTVTANWTYNGGGGGSSYDYYEIKITKEGNGSISSSGGSDNTVTIREWTDKTFTFTPDKGYVVSDVLVDGKSIGAKSSYTFENVKKDHTLKVIFKTSGGHENPQTGVEYEDVEEKDWFYDSVVNAVGKGWFAGTSDTTFSPYLSTTRGMIASVLWRMEQMPDFSASTIFQDVLQGQWYYNGIAWAQNHDIVKGYGNGKYGPNDDITREQLASILYRYAQFKGYDVSQAARLDGFSDGSTVSAYAIETMRWAVGANLISGKGNGILDPHGKATRAEVATILTRFDEMFTK